MEQEGERACRREQKQLYRENILRKRVYEGMKPESQEARSPDRLLTHGCEATTLAFHWTCLGVRGAHGPMSPVCSQVGSLLYTAW